MTDTADTCLTPQKREAFLAALAECGNVSRAAESAGVNRVYMYEVRGKDEDFAKDWEKAARIGASALEDEARRRAFEGVDEPVFYQGKECGAVRRYSDTLLIVLLKAHHPEKYAERSKTEASMNFDLAALIAERRKHADQS